MKMKFQSYFSIVLYCASVFCAVAALPATSPFNPNKLVNKSPKRGNGLRRAFSKDTVRYFLYSNASNPNDSKVLRIGDVASLSPYDVTKGLTLIIHGFKENFTDKHPQELKDALLKKGEPSNIVIASWHGMTLPFKNPHSGLPLNTREASKNIQRVSKHIADFVLYLKNETKIDDLNKVHLIGHGLGAHVAGVVGFKVKHITGDSIGRITGLDPSGPTHTYTALSEKLDQTDGNFVDVLHTTDGPYVPEGPYGPERSIGHLDYYVRSPADPKRDLEGFPGSSSSVMSWDYYTRSILEDGLKACQANSFLSFKLGKSCEKEVQFGHGVSHSARGDYFLSVRSQEQNER